MRTTIGKLVGLQIVVTVLSALVAFFLSGAVAGWSAALGGAIGFVPTAVYGCLLLWRPVGTPRGLLQQHYLGEFGKLAITLLMFGATFVWIKPLSAPPLFFTYVLTLAAYWAALVLFA